MVPAKRPLPLLACQERRASVIDHGRPGQSCPDADVSSMVLFPASLRYP
jgi:hypothetical protein